MADIHVWEETPVNCKVSLAGFGAKPTCTFKFYKANGADAGEAKATIAGGSGSCSWPAPKVEGDDLSMKLTWKAEINGAPKVGYEGDIFVWARQVKITCEEDGAGKPMPRTDLNLRHNKKTLPRTTDEQGVLVFDLMAPGDVEIECRSPYILKSVDKPKGKERKFQIEKRFKVKLLFPTPDGEGKHKQWVNLDADAAKPEQGPKIKIRFAPETKGQGKTGDKIYVKAEFHAENSDRTADTGGHAKGTVLEEEKTLDAKGEAEWELVLGQAGGDSVIITAGGTSAKTDAKVTIVNWRKLYYEILAPESMNAQLPAKMLPSGKSGRDFPDAMTGWFRPRLAKAFIQFECLKTQVWKLANAPAGTIFDNAYFGDATAGKRYVIGDHTSAVVPSGPVTFDASPDSRTVQIKLVDGYFDSDDPAATLNVDMTTATLEYDVPANAYAFAKRMLDGSDAVVSVWWGAQVDPVAHPAHPGVNAGAARIEWGQPDWIEFKTYKKLKLKLPTGVGEPGSFVGPLSATHCPISFSFEIFWAGGVNGSASGGRQTLVFRRPPKPAACTICHELGHSMGMTVMDPTAAAPFGNKPPRGLADPPVVSAGDVYVGHGHTGTHCAFNLADKTLASFGAVSGTCIMFGSGGDEADPRRDQFCPTCQKYIKARKLTDIRSGFKTRADDEC